MEPRHEKINDIVKQTLDLSNYELILLMKKLFGDYYLDNYGQITFYTGIFDKDSTEYEESVKNGDVEGDEKGINDPY